MVRVKSFFSALGSDGRSSPSPSSSAGAAPLAAMARRRASTRSAFSCSACQRGISSSTSPWADVMAPSSSPSRPSSVRVSAAMSRPMASASRRSTWIWRSLSSITAGLALIDSLTRAQAVSSTSMALSGN